MAATNLIFHLFSAAVLLAGGYWIIRLQQARTELLEVLITLVRGKPGRITVATVEDACKWLARHLNMRFEFENHPVVSGEVIRINHLQLLLKFIEFDIKELIGRRHENNAYELILKCSELPLNCEKTSILISELFSNKVTVLIEKASL